MEKKGVNNDKQEISRLESLLVQNDLYNLFRRCSLCDKIYDYSDMFHCDEKIHQENWYCPSCIKPTKCDICCYTFCDPCSLSKMIKCEYNDECTLKVCSVCIEEGGATDDCNYRHILCNAHYKIGMPWCSLCQIIRHKNATNTIMATLGVLKRMYTSDIYLYLMAPHLKNLWAQRKGEIEWDAKEKKRVKKNE